MYLEHEMKNDDHDKVAKEKSVSRRKLLKGTAVGLGAALTMPKEWVKPVVDTVTLPAHAQTSQCSPTIVDIAAGDPGLSTLVLALQTSTAGLVGVLSGPGPFTVFAPTNQAFAHINIPPNIPPEPDLTNILTYHVQSGINPPNIPATNGNTPVAVQATVNACNGVIYVINEVLIP